MTLAVEQDIKPCLSPLTFIEIIVHWCMMARIQKKNIGNHNALMYGHWIDWNARMLNESMMYKVYQSEDLK